MANSNFTLGVSKAENGYIIDYWSDAPAEICDFAPGAEEKRYIAGSDTELARILLKVIKGDAITDQDTAESGPIADHPIRS